MKTSAAPLTSSPAAIDHLPNRCRASLFIISLLFVLFLSGCGTSATKPIADLWSSANAVNYAPASRTVVPIRVYTTSGTVSDPDAMLGVGTTRLSGAGSQITLDFDKDVSGIVTVTFGGASDMNQTVGLAFSESSVFVGFQSDRSNDVGPDDALYTNANGSYTAPPASLRGGFRYVTVFMNSAGWVDLSGISVHFTASPAMADLRAYPNYFLSNDDLLNRIWYAGAYTVQLDTVDPAQGRAYPPPPTGWDNSGVIGAGRSIVTDGAKRDRTVWPGDLGVSQPTAFVSTNDTASSRNALDVLYSQQLADGSLPYCGPPLSLGFISDTYHLWTLIASYDYYLETQDKVWLDAHWPQYKAAVQFSTNKIDSNGVMNVTLPGDWGRISVGGEEISANALLYRVLDTASVLAQAEADPIAAQDYRSAASELKNAANVFFWDNAAGEFRDTPGSNTHPQDGNAFAVLFGLIQSAADGSRVSHALRANWNGFGAVTPERNAAIATFPGSFEVQSHFAANEDQAGLDLIRLEWGYMLDAAIGTKSTFWEGYLADGSFDYPDQGSFMSAAHGWATGPTSALTYFVLGLSPELSANSSYRFIPHPGDLTHVAGRLTLASGPIDASWQRDPEAGTFIETITAPSQIAGRIAVPTFGRATTVLIDGKLAWNGCNPTAAAVKMDSFESVSSDNNYVLFEGDRGSHILSARSCVP